MQREHHLLFRQRAFSDATEPRWTSRATHPTATRGGERDARVQAGRVEEGYADKPGEKKWAMV